MLKAAPAGARQLLMVQFKSQIYETDVAVNFFQAVLIPLQNETLESPLPLQPAASTVKDIFSASQFQASHFLC